MNAFAALTLNGFREARRNRVTLLIAGFALVLLLCSTLLADVSIASIERVLVDMGLSGMSLMLVVLAIFLSTSQLGREIERRTIFMIVSKPVSRATFILGRMAGNMLTLAVLLLAMAAIFWVELALFGYPMRAQYGVAIAALYVELAVLSSVGFAMSSFAGPIVSAMVTAGVYLAGHLSGDIYRLGESAQSAFLTAIAKGVYYLLPNLDRLNFRPHATYLIDISGADLGLSVLYAIAYAGIMLSLSVLFFARRDFK
ncbi:MAG: ABC transporter permease [Myxococcaceae bacterium]|nr:ABC transporter permease [Myxococcaceae bacterium]